MTDDIINLNAERIKRERPDDGFVKKDDYGREMYLYALEYDFPAQMGNGKWATEVWAYSMEDAEARVAAMRESLILKGQIMTAVPAND